MPIISPQKPLQSALVRLSLDGEIQGKALIVFMSVGPFVFIYQACKCCFTTMCLELSGLVSAFIHFNNVVARAVMFLLYCCVSLAVWGITQSHTQV